jgi:CRISPR-associated protein Csb1
MALSLKDLSAAISSRAAAFRCATEYQPMAGKGAAVFPATYEGGKYATVGYRIEDQTLDEHGRPTRDTDRKLADQVLLDSVQSQANRMELERPV